MGRRGRKSGAQVKWRSMRCGHCKEPFDASRSDALFCSAVCRKAEQRLREHVERVMREEGATAADHVRRKAVRK